MTYVCEKAKRTKALQSYKIEFVFVAEPIRLLSSGHIFKVILL